MKKNILKGVLVLVVALGLLQVFYSNTYAAGATKDPAIEELVNYYLDKMETRQTYYNEPEYKWWGYCLQDLEWVDFKLNNGSLDRVLRKAFDYKNFEFEIHYNQKISGLFYNVLLYDVTVKYNGIAYGEFVFELIDNAFLCIPDSVTESNIKTYIQDRVNKYFPNKNLVISKAGSLYDIVDQPDEYKDYFATTDYFKIPNVGEFIVAYGESLMMLPDNHSSIDLGKTGYYTVNGANKFYEFGVVADNIVCNYNGQKLYFKNGKADTSFTGFAKDCVENTYAVANGKVKTQSNGLTYFNNKWVYLKNGKVQSSYSGLVYYNKEWWYVTNGFLDKTFKGITPMNGNSWFVRNGKISRENGYVNFEGNIYKIVNGMVDTKTTAMEYAFEKWYYFRKGVVDWSYNSIAYTNNQWWYINNGELDKTYTGMVPYADQMWYVKLGKLDKSYIGTAKYGLNDYYVINGLGRRIVSSSATTSPYCKYRYTNLENNCCILTQWQDSLKKENIVLGKYRDDILYGIGPSALENCGNFTNLVIPASVKYIDKDALKGCTSIKRIYGYAGSTAQNFAKTNGLAFTAVTDGLNYIGSKWYYFKDGEVASDYTGLVYYKSVWYYVRNGELDKYTSGLVPYNGKLYYVSQGKLDKTYVGTTVYNGVTYNVKNGIGTKQ